jgi:hypothetical protein
VATNYSYYEERRMRKRAVMKECITEGVYYGSFNYWNHANGAFFNACL